MMRTRLPGDAIVGFDARAGCEVGQIPFAYQIDQRLLRGELIEERTEVRLAGREHHDFGVPQQLRSIVNQQSSYMRYAIQDEFAICSHEAGEPDVLIKDPHIVALAEQTLDELHDRTLAQVIGALLETEPEHADAALVSLVDHGQRMIELNPIARKHGGQHRYVDVQAARAIDERPQVLGQAGAAEREAGSQIRRGYVELRVEHEMRHQLASVYADSLG